MLNVMSFATIPEAIEELRAGRMLVVVLGRQCMLRRDSDFVAAGVTSVDARPRSRIARLNKFVECFVSALFEELFVLVQCHSPFSFEPPI